MPLNRTRTNKHAGPHRIPSFDRVRKQLLEFQNLLEIPNPLQRSMGD